MASKNASIEKIFNSVLKTWATAQSIPVAWDGNPYEPVVNTKYVSQVLVPARPQNVAIGKDVIQRRTGVYQIDVYASTENAKYDVDVIIASLESTFKVGYPLTYGGISAQITNFYPDPHGADEGWYRVTISIYYRCEI